MPVIAPSLKLISLSLKMEFKWFKPHKDRTKTAETPNKIKIRYGSGLALGRREAGTESI
jgi:hypothetical protein